MGTVHRALDRLSGEEIALKRVKVALDRLDYGSRTEEDELELTLVQEFKILASLRHPNIISVLDYGFDDQRQPYVTMELLEDAETVYTAGKMATEAVKINLVLQMLRALLYLHRRGILHRDLKPRNVLVTGGQVKLLDFGLSIIETQAEAGEVAGTPSYMAPEIWIGMPASVQSDLYAIGVMAYEIFAGRRPFNTSNLKKLFKQVQTVMPDMSYVQASPAIKNIIQRLLLKEPGMRYDDVAEVVDAIQDATEEVLQLETRATRESFLQAATFVGRAEEMSKLTNAIKQAANGKGQGVLISGESGVGKSRLLDESRTLAMVEGMQVLRGQAAAEGSVPYRIWADILRWLSLITPNMPLEYASAIKPLVPDIERLQDRKVPDAPEVTAHDEFDRLLNSVEQIFHMQKQPLFVVLEDLHWAGDESLALLQRVAARIQDLPLMIVGAYRDDETPHLAEMFRDMQPMPLRRLTETETRKLTTAMLGKSAEQPELLTLLQRETEGNVFFLVEVVRALAEEAGQMSDIGSSPLPAQVLTGGVQGIIYRRLHRVPDVIRPLLEVAAVGGRILDVKVVQQVLEQMGHTPDLGTWLAETADAAVLEFQDGDWRFAHSKLRDGVLDELDDPKRENLHEQTALAIESVYQVSHIQTEPQLAYHWRMAHNQEKEAHYAALAGEQSLRNGAYQPALNYFKRALALQEVTSSKPERRLAAIQQQIGATHFELGQFEEAKKAYQQALVICERTGYKWGIANSLNSLGTVECENGEYDMAAEHFLAALEIAMSSRATPVALSVLTGMADLLAKVGDKQVALEYLSLVMNHPATPAQTHYTAERTLAALEDEFDPETFKRLLEEGKEKNFRATVTAILEN